jgi:cystathionine gamma-synthase
MPGTVHAVTCSIPTMEDVIGYEEKRPETMAKILSGYPRFVTHFYVRRMEEDFLVRNGLKGRSVFITAGERAAADLLAFTADEDAALVREEDLWYLHVQPASDAASRAKAFLQHTGCGISSRRAEAELYRRGLITELQEEDLVDSAGAEAALRGRVAECFGVPSPHVHLATTGMNGFYAAFRAISELQAKQNRRVWVQVGWLYVDTIEVLRKMTEPGSHPIVLNDVLDLRPLEDLLRERGGEIAGIVTEVPTNPLIQTADLPRLRALAKEHQIPLVLDPTLASPLNIDIIRFCDVAVNSLTKYAASGGDVMMGAVVINPQSPWAGELQARVPSVLTEPFIDDLRRLALEIAGFEEVMERINRNTMALVDFLERHPAVEKVFWAYAAGTAENYARVQRRPRSPGGILSIKLRKPIAEFYDRVQLPKGPSFGTTFTLMCPFLYLAHYDLVSTPEGRTCLHRHNLDADLLRISVGTENADRIIAAFAEAL